MKTNILKKLSAVCLVLLISGAAWACGGRCGSCGDKDTKETAVLLTQFRAQNAEEKDQDGGGCKGADHQGCPYKA